MTINTRKQIEVILSDVDAVYQSQMLLAKKEEDLYGKKYDISNRIYSSYAFDRQETNENLDYKESLDWLSAHFYQSKEHVSFWDKSWTIDEHSTLYAKRYGQFYISKGEQFKLVSPGDFIASTTLPNQEKSADLRITRLEILDNSWFYFRGNKHLSTSLLTRVYFHLNYDFEAIAAFSKDLHDELNNWFIPFEYKFATSKTNRLDTGVLYTMREHYFVVFYLVNKIASSSKYVTLFAEGTPAFTKSTALKGVGFAETPATKNTSFGKYRADILADAYIDYYKSKLSSNKAIKLESFVNRKLLEIGFDIKDFFRNPQSRFPYDFSIFNRKINVGRSRVNKPSENYLIWALQIGRIICKKAIMIKKKGITQCYWLSLIEDEAGDYEYRLTDDSFGDGRLGILFFLAKLYSYFPEEYLFRSICKTVLKNIRKNKTYSTEEEHIFKNIEKLLKNRVSAKHADTRSELLSDYPLVHQIDTILDETNSYSKVNNEAPQPIINKGYSAIGLMLLAIHEGDVQELNHLEGYYSKEALLKIINQIKF